MQSICQSLKRLQWLPVRSESLLLEMITQLDLTNHSNHLFTPLFSPFLCLLGCQTSMPVHNVLLKHFSSADISLLCCYLCCEIALVTCCRAPRRNMIAQSQRNTFQHQSPTFPFLTLQLSARDGKFWLRRYLKSICRRWKVQLNF